MDRLAERPCFGAVLSTRGMPRYTELTAGSALAASGVLCTASTTLLWISGIHCYGVRAGVFLNLEPVLGSILGVQF